MSATAGEHHHLDDRSGDPVLTGAGPSVLDRSLNLAAVTWETIAWGVILLTALALRLTQLNGWALSPGEAERAYAAWELFHGAAGPGGAALPETAPLFLLLQALALFLFGATDVIVRLVPALAGFGIVALLIALRPVVGRPAALGMAALAAFSPALVYASRVATPEIVIAFLALALVVLLARTGAAAADGAAGTGRFALLIGVTLGALVASGAAALTVLVTLLVGLGLGVLLNPESSLARGAVSLARAPGALLTLAGGFVATVLVLFTRFFTDPLAIAGVGRTLADWADLLFGGAAQVPVQFFLFELLLYEPLAVLMAVVAALGLATPGLRQGGGAAVGGWFVAALLVWSFSAGRTADHAVLVALPLVLVGGAALGETLARIDWHHLWRGPGGILALVLLGLLTALFAVGILITHPAQGLTGAGATLPAVAVATLVVVPLAYAAWLLVRAERAEGQPEQPALILLLVIAVLLAGFTFRSAVMLSLFRGDTGTELLAQRTASGAILPTVQRLERLSRDATVVDGSARDATGGHGLVIAADEAVQWPFRWYFRDFPSFIVTPDGTAASSGAQVVIASDLAQVEAAGYRGQSVAWVTQVPANYANLDAGTVLRDLVLPSEWLDGSRFLLYREGVPDPGYQQIGLGLNAELAGRISPSTGPYSLSDRPGPGPADGQFNQPLGVAVAADGTIYVVDQGNSRIQLFSADGAFLEAWDGANGGVALARTPNGLGPTGISVDRATGAIYVADTWNHRVVVLDPAGGLIMEIGAPPDPSGARLAADTSDDPALAGSQPGAFFGPRDVAVANGEIYVVDTGNERIQVFGPDGSFRRAWGGYGSGPDRLIEPVGIAVDESGIIYVADSGNARISLFTPEGEPVTQWPVAAWPAPDPAGVRPAFQPYLAFDAEGNLYATSADTGSAEVLDPDGQWLETIQSAGGNRLQRPTGIGVAPDGEVLITDTLANAVFRYMPPLLPSLSDIQVLIPDLADATPEAGSGDPEEVGVDAGADTGAAGGDTDPAGADEPDPGIPPTSRSIPPPPDLGS